MNFQKFWEIYCFISSPVGFVAASVQLWGDYKRWKTARNLGMTDRFSLKNPAIVVVALTIVLVMPVLGFWLVYHPPVAVAIQNHKSASRQSNPLPGSQASVQVPAASQRQQTPPKKSGKKALPAKSISPTMQATTQPPTYGPQSCLGSACAQGPGSQATFNQFGEPRRLIKVEFIKSLQANLTANPGKVFITANSTGDDLARQLFDIFKSAGWSALIGTQLGQEIPDGVHLEWKGDPPPGNEMHLTIPEDRPDVRTLFRALRGSGIEGLDGVPVTTLLDHQIIIEIGENPQ